MSYEVRLIVTPANEAPKELEKWESEDGYHNAMRTLIGGEANMKARKYPYIVSSEGTAGTMLHKAVVPVDGPISVVYLDGQADAGLPHTRGKAGIALPIFLLWNPNPDTIDHELVHISQKQYSERWWSFYTRAWNFRKARESEFMSIPERWRRRRRMNPDTLGSPYTIWKDRYIPMTVFISEISPDLRFCKRGFWDISMSQWTWETPSGWTDLFGSGFNDEHPNEIAAHWIDGSAGEKRKMYFHLNPI
jgi:hypothetical protein